MTASFLPRLIFLVLTETVGDVLFFPLWWYTRGLARAARGTVRFIRDRARALGLVVWIKNFFQPMYGQRDWQGYLISLVFRCIILVYRSVVFCVWILGAGIFFILYCIVPLIAVYGFILSF